MRATLMPATGSENSILSSIDPATAGVVWEGAISPPAEIPALVTAARIALSEWAAQEDAKRVEILQRYAAILHERSDMIASVISRETGKPRWESRAELASMIGKIAASIEAREERAGTRANATDFGKAVLRHRPHGVMAVLGPYNFPGHLPNGHIVPALLAGNVVIFKPSEETPWTGELLVDALHDAGVPPGVVQIVQGDRNVGAALVACDIDGVLFTGSPAAGKNLRRALVDRPNVILALELGGNNPLIVWDNPKLAAAIIVQSAFVTAGQRCTCARRLIVPKGQLGDEILAECIDLTAQVVVGPWDDAVVPFMGPLISVAAAHRVRAQYEALIEIGAVELLPARWEEKGGAYVNPALIDVTGLDVPDVEIFGPVLQVVRADDFEQAVKHANNTVYGLSAGLVSENVTQWNYFLAQSRAGVVNWNRPTTGAAANMPFGGTGCSGNHRPSAYYASDYCAYPVASFEAANIADLRNTIPVLTEHNGSDRCT